MAIPQKLAPGFTVDQYLAIERASTDRHEFIDGEIYAMANESPFHGEVSFNIAGIIRAQLKGTHCRGRTKDTKVRSGPAMRTEGRGKVMFSYPDIVIYCGKGQYHDEAKDVLINPMVIIEVLSPSTESFDRGEKFTRYSTWNDTLTDFLLVSQDRATVDHYSRGPDGAWLFQRHEGLSAVISISSIGCRLSLDDVYDNVEFDAD